MEGGEAGATAGPGTQHAGGEPGSPVSPLSWGTRCTSWCWENLRTLGQLPETQPAASGPTAFIFFSHSDACVKGEATTAPAWCCTVLQKPSSRTRYSQLPDAEMEVQGGETFHLNSCSRGKAARDEAPVVSGRIAVPQESARQPRAESSACSCWVDSADCSRAAVPFPLPKFCFVEQLQQMKSFPEQMKSCGAVLV